MVAEASVYGGEIGRVPLKAEGAIRILVARDAKDALKARVVYQGPLMAPVEEGAEVGALQGLGRRPADPGDAALHRRGGRARPAPLARARCARRAAVRLAVRAARPLHHARRRGGSGQVRPGGAACGVAERAGDRRPRHARAGRQPARGDAAEAAALRALRAARAGGRGARLRARARRSSGRDDPPGAAGRHLGDLRPLHRFHPRLSGRRRRRSERCSTCSTRSSSAPTGRT